MKDLENKHPATTGAGALAAAAALLRKMEWEEVRYEYRDSQYFCPVCDADKRDGHSGACELAAVLKIIDGQSTATPPVEQHTDDMAVDCFARALKAKLASARTKGRGGWDTPECTQQRLSDMLREHVAKGDPRDVANFCMFLWARGEAIISAESAARDSLENLLELIDNFAETRHTCGHWTYNLKSNESRQKVVAALKGNDLS